MIKNQPKDFWPPLAACIGFGLTLMGMFRLTGHGLGANGFFTRPVVWLGDSVASAWTELPSATDSVIRQALGTGKSAMSVVSVNRKMASIFESAGGATCYGTHRWQFGTQIVEVRMS